MKKVSLIIMLALVLLVGCAGPVQRTKKVTLCEVGTDNVIETWYCNNAYSLDSGAVKCHQYPDVIIIVAAALQYISIETVSVE